MSHVEFVGPPGAGKSALLSVLAEQEGWYQPIPEEACRRRLLDTANLKYRIAYRAMPPVLRSFFDSEFLTPRYRREAFDEFAKRRPDALQSLLTGIGTVEHQPAKLFRLSRRTIERYRLGIATVRDGERLCLDESFSMRAASLLWREPSDAFSLGTYLRETPTPEVLVHVDAPPDVCLDRQRDRGRVSVSEPWSGADLQETQRRFQTLCETVADEQRFRTTVLEIESAGSVEDTVQRIRDALAEESVDDGGAGSGSPETNASTAHAARPPRDRSRR